MPDPDAATFRSYQPGRGHAHRHGTGEPGWLEHEHLDGGLSHYHDPETSFQVALPRDDAASLADSDTITAAAQYLPNPETLNEACYLVSRGVRPLAFCGTCAATPVVMTAVRTVLHRALQAELTIPFVIPERGSPGLAAFGYASHRWCIDLYEWATSGEIPMRRKHEIIGLLCGYSPPAIARHQEYDRPAARPGEKEGDDDG